MRLLVLATLAAVSAAAPQGYGYQAPRQVESAESVEVAPAPAYSAPAPAYSAPRSLDSVESAEFIPILRDDRVHEEDGTHNFEFETGNGIAIEQSGDTYGNKQGVISFTHPDGTPFYMTFVADGNGFQPQSDALPVAPAFPHPIPDFVLRQIEKARLEDEAAAREAKSSVRTPNAYYAQPDSSEEEYRSKRDVPAFGYSIPRPQESAESVESVEVAPAYSAPAPRYSAPRSLDSAESFEIIPILRDDRIHEEDGTYNFDVETANGIVASESGDSDGNKQGVISFTHPDGTPFYMTFVADENGFQPQSDALPVAPAFPHPIPDFVLRQIEKARLEDEAAARAAKSSASAPRSRYAAPDSSEEGYN